MGLACTLAPLVGSDAAWGHLISSLTVLLYSRGVNSRASEPLIAVSRRGALAVYVPRNAGTLGYPGEGL